MSIPAILQQLGVNPQLLQVKNVIDSFKNLQNPQAAMQQLISQKNPQMMQAIKYVQENGGDPKAAFEKLAAEKGINPAEIEQMFK